MIVKQMTQAIIGCIPIHAHPTHPTDQFNCTQEACPVCGELMWVSERKRAMRTEKHIKAWCLQCVCNQYGPNLQMIDIRKMDN